MAFDKERLFTQQHAEAEVDVPGLGVMRVRPLTRAEVLLVRKATDSVDTLDGKRQAAIEAKMLSLALVDPQLTEAEVRRWQESSLPHQIGAVSAKVQEISGLAEEAPKAAYKSVRD